MTSNPNEPTWYVRNADGKAAGPHSVTQILIAVQAGRLGADSMVASVTGRKWVPASAIPEVAS